MKREVHLQGILHISQKRHLSGSPVKEPSLKVPLWSPSQSDAPPLEPSFFHLSKSLLYESPKHQVPLGRKGAPMERDACIRKLSQHIF